MEIAFSKLQENFKAKRDGELLSLASNAAEMAPESRLVLLEELRQRVNAMKDHPTSIQLVHGWYTVLISREHISFPDICPTCLQKGADAEIAVPSMNQEQNRLLYVKLRSVTLRFPSCQRCARRMTRRNRLISWPSYFVLVAWFVFCWMFHLGRLAAYFGALLFSLPMVLLLRQGAAVTLGDFGTDWLECRFRSPKYAEAFASVNHAKEQNTENIREEMEAGIQSIQSLASGGKTNI
jgi:hypothetical protein